MLPRLTVRHDTLRRAQDRHAQPITNTRDLRDADITPETRSGNTLKIADNRLTRTNGILENYAKDLAAFLRLERAVVLDVGVLLEDLRNLRLHFGSWHVHATMLRPARVADPRQHIRNWICHTHRSTLPRPVVSAVRTCGAAWVCVASNVFEILWRG